MLIIVTFFNNPLYATEEKGDTLVIHQTDHDATPWNEIVAADTNDDGSRKHLVYELEPGGWYPMSGKLTAGTYDLHIVSGERTSGESRPYILVQDGWSGWYMLSGEMNIILEGLHIMQCDETSDGNITAWARAGLEVTGENAEVILHDNIWDFNTGFALSASKDGLNMKVTNCLFRFNKPLNNSVWSGQGFDISSAELDTVIMQNCTWYGGGSFLTNTWESTENLFKMDHCTIADWVQFPIHGVHYTNAEFTNMLFYNAHTMGEDSMQIGSTVPDPLPYGILNIDTLYTDLLGVVDYAKEATRNMIVKNNNNFVKQNIKDYWAVAMSDPVKYHGFVVADPTFYDGFMNSRTRAMFEDDETWPGLILKNTTSLDPQFEDYFDYSDTLINYSKYYYNQSNGAWPDVPATTFMLDPDGEPLSPTDPMFYNLKITNPELRKASTTGGPIGDLTWELPDGYNSVQSDITDVEANNTLSTEFVLNQNYPNPFNPTTNIEFAVPKSDYVTLKVFNILGQEVATLINRQMSAGSYKIDFDASELSSGIYIYRLKAGSLTSSKKMILLK
jgi:hypothetical protein